MTRTKIYAITALTVAVAVRFYVTQDIWQEELLLRAGTLVATAGILAEMIARRPR